MSLTPVKPKTLIHFPSASRLERSKKAQTRFANNLTKLKELGIALSLDAQNSLAGANRLHPAFRLVLESIQLHNCLSAQAALDMINLNLQPILTRAEVRPDQKLPKKFVLQELARSTPAYQHLLEVELQS